MKNFFREWGALILTGFIILLVMHNVSKGGAECKSDTFDTYYSPSTGCIYEFKKGEWQSINYTQGK